MSDVTIPAEVARRIAGVLRFHAETVPRSPAGEQWSALADLLDPPPESSLRDEALSIVRDADPYLPLTVADDILAVALRHIEALPMSSIYGIDRLDRDDVLRLLNGGGK